MDMRMPLRSKIPNVYIYFLVMLYCVFFADSCQALPHLIFYFICADLISTRARSVRRYTTIVSYTYDARRQKISVRYSRSIGRLKRFSTNRTSLRQRASRQRNSSIPTRKARQLISASIHCPVNRLYQFQTRTKVLILSNISLKRY